MKSIILFCLGIFLGILAIDFAISCIISLFALSLGAGIASGVFALVCAFLAMKCFNNI
jgi:hypothetical protein